MAGIIAGRERAAASGSTYAVDTSNFYGMAPDARIISIKLADHGGAVDVSQMIAAIDWVVANQTNGGMNIRILNISYGVMSKQSSALDPLSWAAESAWKKGIVVVASAGNDGNASGIASPAYNPWVIAVGASDTKGTTSMSDDTVATFSQKAGADGRAPDLLAPGVGIVSLADPGSAIASAYPGAKVGNGLFRGSGTSQASAVVSGAVALLLQQYPGMWPDDVKKHLTGTATKLPSATSAAQGFGELNSLAASNAANTYGTKQSAVNGTGLGTLDAARGGNYVTIAGTPLTGEKDVMGTTWRSSYVTNRFWSNTLWSNGKFLGADWSGSAFGTDTSSWAGRTWSGRTWSGRTWSASLWVGRTWSGGTWTSTGWSSASWTGPVASPAWASNLWSSASWR